MTGKPGPKSDSCVKMIRDDPHLFIGYTEDGSKLQLTEDDLETHVHGIGSSRSGKSKFIAWIARNTL